MGLRTTIIRGLTAQFRDMSNAGNGTLTFAELCMNYPCFNEALKAAGAYL